MEKRRHQTVADFAAIAICPSLIVLLIASLVYFLVICLYRGSFSGRIGYIFFMFIVGAVGIARLSIQESRKYALGYAAVLGLATFFVVSTFVTVQGPFAALSPIINAATIALVWFLADRITFDCTVIDEEEDAGGQGLLDGLSDDASSGRDGAQHASRKRGRQPGRTVLWLTAAALPIFGIGQLLLPQEERWHRSAIFALAIYLFAAISLLVATSFLGVRRYLRQRGVDMPANVSTAWLAGGIAMTAIMLLVCFFLPQPGKMLANAELPSSFQALQSPDWLKPSQYGWGSETASPDGNEKDASSVPAQSPDQEAGESGGPDSQSEKSSGEAGGQKPGEQGEGGEKSGGTKKSEGEQKGQSEGKDDSQEKSGDNQKSDNQKSESGKASERNAEENAGNETSDKAGESKPSESGGKQPDAPDGNQQPISDAEQNETASQTPPPSEPLSARTRPSKPLELPSLPSLGNVFKVAIYLVLIGFLVFFAWIQREEIANAWRAFLAWLRGETSSDQAALPMTSTPLTTKPAIPFSAFRNPLASSADPREAIIVTYQAAEAWWREHGQARKPDETPSEFIRRLKRTSTNDHEAMIRLTDAYNRIVYGNDSAKQPDLDAAAAVWKSFSRSI